MSKLRLLFLSFIVFGISVLFGVETKKTNAFEPTVEKESNNKELIKIALTFAEKHGAQKAIELLQNFSAKKTLTDVPLKDVLPQILLYAPQATRNVACVCNDFVDVIYEKDEFGKLTLKKNFLRVLLLHKHVFQGCKSKSISKKERDRRFWEFLARTGYTESLKIFKEIIDEDINFNRILDEKTLERPIHILARHADILTWWEVFSFSRESKAKVDLTLLNDQGESAIDIAVKSGNIQAIRFLKAKGPQASSFFLMEVAECLMKPEKEMFEAAESGYNSEVEVLTGLYKKIIYARDLHGMTVLHIAAMHGRAEMIKKFVKLGAKLEARDMFGRTALHVAAKHGKIKVIGELIGLGAKLEGRDKFGRTPLFLAVKYGKIKVVRMLKIGGADINVFNKYGESLLHTAARYGKVGIMQLLITLGVNPKLKAKEGKLKGKTALDLYKSYCKKSRRGIDPETVIMFLSALNK